MKTQFKLDDVISDSLLWVSHENYIKQFDISRVGDAICKACKGVQPMQDTMLDTFCTAVGRNYPGHRNVEQVEGVFRVEPQYCHGDVKGGQEYDGGHLLDTLASAAEYVEGRRSIDEQDAAHMSPEVCRGDSGQMDSSHSDYYGQTSSYHSNLDMLAASATWMWSTA
ncbi:hypothetical protein BASA61_001847 [Batrachochytrium salamandrivorans]|nr:hypothetical protein BASA61_001847 [Batrachochytrium salamandrivorans]